jgi:hypothetical protein
MPFLTFCPVEMVETKNQFAGGFAWIHVGVDTVVVVNLCEALGFVFEVIHCSERLGAISVAAVVRIGNRPYVMRLRRNRW